MAKVPPTRMIGSLLILLTLPALGILVSGCPSKSSSPTTPSGPANTATPLLSSTPTGTPTTTASPTITATPTKTASTTPTGTPTSSPTSSPSMTPSGTPTATATKTATPTITDSATVTPSFTPSGTPTVTATDTPTSTVTNTPTVTPDVVELDAGSFHNMNGLVYANGTLYAANSGDSDLFRLLDNLTTITLDYATAAVTTAPYNTMAVTVSGGSVTCFVPDTTHNLVWVYYDTGSAFSEAASFGTGFSDPDGIGIDGSGNVYVSDKGNNQIQWYSYDFTNNTATVHSPIVTTGIGLKAPGAITGDGSGNFYVVATDSTSNAPFYKFVPGSPLSASTSFGSFGSGAGYFSGQSTGNALTVDTSTGKFFAVDAAYNLVLEYSTAGVFENSWGVSGPQAVASNNAGSIYIATSNDTEKYNEP